MIPAIANHLWQSTAFAAVAALLAFILRKNHARIRHAVWFAASLKFLLPLSALIEFGGRIHWRSAARYAQPALSAVIDQVSQPFAPSPLGDAAPHTADPLPMVLLGVWAAGFLGIAISWFVRWKRIDTVVRNATRLSLDLPIEARSTAATFEPGVVGVFRQTLLLPDGIFEHLTRAQLHAIFAHELCHVRRRDNLTAAIQMFIETVFWFHPAIWWIGKRMIAERELACDEEVLLQGGERRAYAEGILNVCRLYAATPLRCAAGVTGSDLKMRIQAILAGCKAREMTLARKTLVTAAALTALIGPLLAGALHSSMAQAFQANAPGRTPAAAGRFEAASIRVHTGEIRRIGARMSGSRIAFDAFSVANLIAWSYQVRQFQVTGGPAWTASDNRYDSRILYDVDAKAEGEQPRTAAEFREMTQALLAARFHTILRREWRHMPVYALTIDRHSPKLRESPTPGGLVSDGNKFTATGISMEILARQLSNAYGVDRPVIDETGLNGVYDFTLEFGRPELSGGEFSGPSLFTALREQIGLRLQPKNAPVEVLVIDGVEKPDAN